MGKLAQLLSFNHILIISAYLILASLILTPGNHENSPTAQFCEISQIDGVSVNA
jgi:hypothetical protein